MLVDRGTLIGFLIVLLPISILFEELSYYDELLVLGTCSYAFLFRKTVRYRIELRLLTTIFILGIISNILYPIYPSIVSVLIDAFTCFKPLLILIILPGFLKSNEQISASIIFLYFSRIYIVIVFVLGLISQVMDLGLTEDSRYGINAFLFVFPTHSSFGITVIACVLILGMARIRAHIFSLYFVLAFVTLLLTTKGVIYSFLSVTVFLFFFKKEGFRIKMWQIMSIVLLIGALSVFQIKSYILDAGSPRMAFIISSVQLAIEFFPFGTGFATFGGQEAFDNYSVLYERFGFENIYGLSRSTGFFANDNYMAMILAQNGFIGLILYILLLFFIFKKINIRPFDSKKIKVLVVAALLMMYVSSIATGIFKSAIGVFLACVISIVISNNSDNEKKSFFDNTQIK